MTMSFDSLKDLVRRCISESVLLWLGGDGEGRGIFDDQMENGSSYCQPLVS